MQRFLLYFISRISQSFSDRMYLNFMAVTLCEKISHASSKLCYQIWRHNLSTYKWRRGGVVMGWLQEYALWHARAYCGTRDTSPMSSQKACAHHISDVTDCFCPSACHCPICQDSLRGQERSIQKEAWFYLLEAISWWWAFLITFGHYTSLMETTCWRQLSLLHLHKTRKNSAECEEQLPLWLRRQ